MDVKGSCYFSHIHNQHVIVILSDSDDSGYALVVPLSSIKFKDNGKYKYNNQFCNFYDDSCVIDIDEIISDKGMNVLSKPTYALYKLAGIISVNNISEALLNGTLEYRCVVSDDLLSRLQDGAKKTIFLEEHLKKFFMLF